MPQEDKGKGSPLHFPMMEDGENKVKKKGQVIKCAARISQPQQDSCWSWVVCLAGVMSNVIVCGFAYSYGILFPSILDEFHEGKAKTAWIGSTAMMGIGIFGPLAGKLYHRFGARIVSIIGALICVASLIATSKTRNVNIMFLTYGGLYGVGSSFVFITVYLIVPRYFAKWRSLSLGLIAMGPGGGLFIMSPIVQAFFERLGWRGAFFAMAGVVFAICVLCCTFRPIRLESDDVRYNQERSDNFWDISILSNKEFMIYTTAGSIFYLGHYIPTVHMVRYCQDLGFPENQASRLYIYSGLSSLLIRPVIGRLHDVAWITPCYIYSTAAALEGVSAFLLPLATSNLHFVLYFALYGVCDGATGCGLSIAILNSLPEKQRPLGFGVYQCIASVLSAVGPALGGFVADIEGSYVPVFYMVGSLAVVGAALMPLVTCFKKPDEFKKTSDRIAVESLIIVEKCSVV